MKIKTRLSLQFTFLVAGILIFFSILIYYFSWSSQRTRFRENILRRARNTGVLLTNVTEIDSALLKKIHLNTRSWDREEIVVIDSLGKVIYYNNRDYLSSAVVKFSHMNTAFSFFTLKDKDCVIYNHRVDGASLIVYVAAYDLYRVTRLSSLKHELSWSIFFSIILSVFASYFFAKKAIRPLSEVVKRIGEINISKLGERLDEGEKKDEIEKLAVSFNNMLENLEISFKSQKEFVTNASHELRTPLAVMISETDYLLNSNFNQDELVNHTSKLLEDLKTLNAKTNSLLELANLNRDNKITFDEVRIDEIIYNAILSVKSRFPGRKILSKVDYTENESDMVIKGNDRLLEIAFKNIIDNACKFSEEDVNIVIQNTGEIISVSTSDKGIGIPSDEINNVCRPFMRGANAKYINGFGIGLALALRIFEIHNANLNISSIQNLGTRVEVVFDRNPV